MDGWTEVYGILWTSCKDLELDGITLSSFGYLKINLRTEFWYPDSEPMLPSFWQFT
jgi:hypothetical protein